MKKKLELHGVPETENRKVCPTKSAPGKEYVLKNDVLRLIHETGGCDAGDQWGKGFDASCDTLYSAVLSMETVGYDPGWIPAAVPRSYYDNEKEKGAGTITLNDFMSIYTGNSCISIDGYCEEMEYDYYIMPDEEEENFKGNNPNRYIPSCLARESWWGEVKDREIAKITVIGGGMYKVELCILLKED